MALPNPQGKLVDNTGKSAVTLGELLRVQSDVEKWSQNTDINTFRSGIEAQKGFDQLIEKQSETTTTLKDNRRGSEEDTKELFKDGKGINKKIQLGIEAGFKDAGLRIIRSAVKPFEGLAKNLNDFRFKEMGVGFLSLTRGAERVGSGFKEITNGIGEFGPVVNSLKTGIFKAVAVFNIFRGLLEVIISGLRDAFFGLTKFFFNPLGEPDDSDLKKTLETENENDPERKKLEKNLEDLGKDKPKNEGVNVMFIDGTPSYFDNMRRALGLALEDAGFLVATATGNNAYEDEREKAEKRHRKNQSKHDKAKNEAQKLLDLKLNKQRKDNETKLLKWKKGQELKFMLLRMLKIFAPLLLLGAAAFKFGQLLGEKFENLQKYPIAGIFTGIQDSFSKAMGKFSESIKSMGKNLKTILSKIPGIGRFFKEGADDAGKEVAKKTAQSTAGKIGKTMVKKIPVVGAAIEAGVDMGANASKFERIKAAYENGDSIMPDGEGGLRPMTADEFKAAEQSMDANRAGSVGRGAGALAGAATGAAIGSFIPIVGTAVGGLIGGVIGGIFGGRAGDKIATNLANEAEGIDDPQAYIDMLAANAPDLVSEAGSDLQNANMELAEVTDAGAGGQSMTLMSEVKGGDSSTQHHYHEIPVRDQQADLAYT